jgi:hypothetical protein
VSEYIPPRNAVNELIQRVPDELRQLLIETWKEHEKQSESWPDVPYHYGQGRIREYEVWRDSLSEQDQKQEIAAVRVRYEAYYDAMARSLVGVMAKQGHDISTYLMDVFDQPPPERRPPVPPIGKDGAPIYDERFFLALAHRGADVWNEWRARHSGEDDQTYIRVNFAKIDFVSVIDFSGFNFGHGANFSGASFRRRDANFCGATFGREADFSGADFTGSLFERCEANFSGSTFGAKSNFSGAIFGDFANFSGATFGARAKFSGATFGAEANFSGAIFGNFADLSGATFGPNAKLTGWSPDEQDKFRNSLVEGPLSDVWSEDRKAAFVMRTEPGAVHPDKFLSISFMAARFLGGVDFSGRQFDDVADFTLARFDELPRFESLINVNLHGAAKIRFTRNVLDWTNDSVAATQLRYLRKLADDAKNHDLERNLYIEERRAERGEYFFALLFDAWINLSQQWRNRRVNGLWSVAGFPGEAVKQIVLTTTRLLVHIGWIAMMGLYWLLADYGRSFIRPFLALLLSVVLFNAAYWLVLRPQGAPHVWPRITAAIERAITRPHPNDPSFVRPVQTPALLPLVGALEQAITWPQANDPPFVRAVRAFALANSVPFVGALTLDKEIKERLICGDQPVDAKKALELGVPPCVPIPRLRFQALALLQTIVSSACVFFIALALRNYFRVR